jgi:nitronate monooxygenase
MNAWRSLKIGDLIARTPIIQGGMGVGISRSGLATAVANAGGIGVIACAGIGMLEPDSFSDFVEANLRALRHEIRKVRAATKGILGVNIMVALTQFAEFVRIAVEEKVDIIFSGAGLPLNLPELVREKGRTKLAPIVSSARAAGLIIRKWAAKYGRLPDAVVVEGPLAGGHLGFSREQIDDPAFALDRLIPEVVAEVKIQEEKHGSAIPVIAAGGIFTGADIRRFIDLGSAGVQMATRFVGTDECDASPAFKQAFIDSERDDLVIIQSPVGMLGRAIRNQFLDDVEAGKKKPFTCPYHCIVTCKAQDSPYCIALALTNALKGKLTGGFVFAGANSYRVNEIVPVHALIETLRAEYESSACGGEASAPAKP